jgi:uncharacterized membrane protein YqhA
MVICLICIIMAATTSTTVFAQTTIQFIKPVRLSSQISSVTVPNNTIPNKINAFEASLLADLLVIGMRGVKGLTVSAITADFPTPTFQFTGTTANTVKLKVSGLKKVVLRARLDLKFFPSVFCFGFPAVGDITVNDLSITATYDYFNGSF